MLPDGRKHIHTPHQKAPPRLHAPFARNPDLGNSGRLAAVFELRQISADALAVRIAAAENGPVDRDEEVSTLRYFMRCGRFAP
jgi:hypothetical protein